MAAARAALDLDPDEGVALSALPNLAYTYRFFS